MSGGHFDYKQYYIEEIADEIESVIKNNGKVIPYEDLDEWDQQYYDPKDPPTHPYYPPEVIEEFKEGLIVLRQAAVYAQRIDWLLSGDDGENSFIERLKEELNELNNGNKRI